MVKDRLKILKAQKGWSNKKLAEAANLPEDTVAKICSGVTRNPNTDTLRRLAQALDVTLDELTAEPDHIPVLPQEKTPVPVANPPACGEVVRIYEQQIAKMEERYERRLAEAHAREAAAHKKGEIRFYVLLGVVVALIALSVYLSVDALHGDWGLFQYQTALQQAASHGSL